MSTAIAKSTDPITPEQADTGDGNSGPGEPVETLATALAKAPPVLPAERQAPSDALARRPEMTSDTSPSPGPTTRKAKADFVIIFGYIMSSVLVMASLVFALILSYIVIRVGENPNLIALRLMMSCIAMFIGMAFACLGFGLFLINAKGGLEAEQSGLGGQATMKLSATAPGLVAMLCATAIVYQSLNIEFRQEGRPNNDTQLSTTHQKSETKQEPLGGNIK